MVEITSPKTETSVGVNLTVDTVQYWCHHTQQFAKTQVEKAKKFVENNCYEYNGEGFFLCNPIKGYNTRTYTIRKNKETNEFDCNCQKGREGSGTCAHVLGLYFAFKLNYFREGGQDGNQ